MNSSAKTRIVAQGIALYAAYQDMPGNVAKESPEYAAWQAWEKQNPQWSLLVREQQFKLFDAVNSLVADDQPHFYFTVSADHVCDKYAAHARIVKVSRDQDKYFATSDNYGCGKSYATKEAAIRGLLLDNGCTNIRITAKPY